MEVIEKKGENSVALERLWRHSLVIERPFKRRLCRLGRVGKEQRDFIPSESIVVKEMFRVISPLRVGLSVSKARSSLLK